MHREKMKKKSYGPQGNSKDPRSPVAQSVKPIELLKDVEFRKGVQPAFKSTTRDAWQTSHASKTNPPDVGKYTPQYRQLDPDLKSAVVRDEHLHLG